MEGCVPGLWAMNAWAQLAQHALTLSLEALGNPNPPFAKDIPALSCCVLSQRHLKTTGGQPATSSSPWQMRKRARGTMRTVNRALSTILLRRVVCSAFVVRTSASPWSPCHNGVPNTRIPCSFVDNDWSPLHTITGGTVLLPSTICSQPTGKTPARFHNCVFP